MKRIILIISIFLVIAFVYLALFFNSPAPTKSIEEMVMPQFNFFIQKNQKIVLENVAKNEQDLYSLLVSARPIEIDPLRQLSSKEILIGANNRLLLITSQKVEELFKVKNNEKIIHFSLDPTGNYLAVIAQKENQKEASLIVLEKSQDSESWNQMLEKKITIPFSKYMYTGWLEPEFKVVLFSSSSEKEIVDLKGRSSEISTKQEILNVSFYSKTDQHHLSEGMLGNLQGEIPSWDESVKLIAFSRSRILWRDYTFQIKRGEEEPMTVWHWTKFPFTSYIQNIEWLSNNHHLLVTFSNSGTKKFFVLDTATKDIAYLGQGEEISWIDTTK